MAEFKYRDYVIMTRKMGPRMAALIKPPNSPLALSEIPQATAEEGEAVLMARAKAAIDKDLDG